MRPTLNHKGFTLIEIAVVLVIIGMLVGAGASMMGPMTNFVRVRETKDQQENNIQSIIGWASSKNSIPYATNLDPTYATHTANTDFNKVAKSPKDAWYQDFLYLYDAELYKQNPSKDNICGRGSTLLKLELETGTINNIAFMIVSRADNKNNNAFKSTFTAQAPAPARSFEADSSYDGATGKVIEIPTSGPNSGITPSGYAKGTIKAIGSDNTWINPDIVRWVTLDELRSKVGCQGAPLKIVNNELPSGATSSYPAATLYADGGVPDTGKYWWCIENTSGVKPAGLTFQGNGTDILFYTDANCQPNINSWIKADNILIQKDALIPSITGGTHKFTVFVKDNNPSIPNIANKPFVISISP